MALTNTKVKQLKSKEKTYKIADEKGLYLEIHINGSKYWRHKYRFAGKEKRLAHGVYPKTTFKEARNKRDTSRKFLEQGIDPSAVKKARKDALIESDNNSFKAIERLPMDKEIKKHLIRPFLF